MRFTGSIEAKLDAKGRVFFPSDFRRKLAEPDATLVLKRDVYQPCLVIYPYSVWEAEVETLRQRLNRWDARQAMLFRQFLADVEVFTLDTSGRFLVPRRLFQACSIDHTVRFIGVDDRVELWGAEQAAQAFLQPDDFAAAMEQLMGQTF